MKLPIQNPTADYKTCPRAFNCRRSNGTRRHAGVDLYAPVGTPVVAIEDGEIIRPVYLFYLGTYALEIKHPSGIFRYGEIQQRTPKPWKAGDKVKEGEILGYVGRLQGLNFSMLHLEMYSGNETGPLTQPNNPPFLRRKDLVDPTSFLDSIVNDNKTTS